MKRRWLRCGQIEAAWWQKTRSLTAWGGGSIPITPGVYDDPGAFGSVSFLDVERGFGGYVAIDDYTRIDADAPARLVRRDIIPLLQSAFDAVAE